MIRKKVKNDYPKQVWNRLKKTWPDVNCALDYTSPFQLLVATILSAQCTDARVNMVTPGLFRKYKTPKDFLAAPLEDIETAIKSTGFYHNKAKNIQGAARVITENFRGKVPEDMESLLTLPGVGRKTANVVLGNAFGIIAGVVVDTHVSRLSQRIGLSKEKTPGKIEKDLVGSFPEETWVELSHLLIQLGRKFCKARNPDCERCPLNEICPRIGVEYKKKT